MLDGWYTPATPPDASGANAYAYSAGNVGSGWVLTKPQNSSDDSEEWFCLQTVRDSKNKVARGVPFYYNGFRRSNIRGKQFSFKR